MTEAGSAQRPLLLCADDYGLASGIDLPWSTGLDLLFGVENVIARIYDPGRAEVYERLGVPTIATVPWAADQVLRRLLPAGSEPMWRDQSGRLRLDTAYAPFAWVGRTVAALEADTGARVAFITRLGAGVLDHR